MPTTTFLEWGCVGQGCVAVTGSAPHQGTSRAAANPAGSPAEPRGRSAGEARSQRGCGGCKTAGDHRGASFHLERSSAPGEAC